MSIISASAKRWSGIGEWSGVLETPNWSGVLETPNWSRVLIEHNAEIIDILEKVHVQFCKLLLNLKTSTPIYINGEIGRYPLNIHM
jgi:hypothetical protein